MTPEQIEHLFASRGMIEGSGSDVRAELLHILGRLDPETYRLFTGGRGSGRCCDVANLLDLLVRATEDPRVAMPVAAALGRHHAEAGVSQNHYHTTGVALLRALERVLGDRFNAEVRDDWAEAFALVSALMERAGHRTGEYTLSRDQRG